MDVDKPAILLLCDAPCERNAMLDKHTRRLVSRYLLMILGRKRDGDAPALQLARQRLGAGLFSSALACLCDHSSGITNQNDFKDSARNEN